MTKIRRAWRTARTWEKIAVVGLPVGTLGLTTHYWLWGLFIILLPKLKIEDWFASADRL